MNLIKIILIVLSTFIFVLLIVPYIERLSLYIGAVDNPNKRKVHDKVIPSMGGLAIFFGFLLGYMFFSEPRIDIISILIGSFIIVIAGIFDDVSALPASVKLLFQLMAAFVVVFYGQVLLDDFYFLGIKFNLGYFSYPLSIFWIIGMINAINLIDGLDGLAAGISSIYFLTIAIIAVLKPDVFTATLALIMLGSTLGFLKHNFYPAKIFMGDTGSMFLGFIISIIPLFQFKNATILSLIVPLLILAIPIFDTLFAIVRRLLKRESISKPDKQHLHHQIMNRNVSHRSTVLIIYGINILFSIVAVIYSSFDRNLGIILLIPIATIILFLVEKTDVIGDNFKPLHDLLKMFKT